MDAAVQPNPPSRPAQTATAPVSPVVVRFTRTYRQLVKGKNINEQTLLATDYLNHFNEVIMLLGMVPSMPECLDDAKEWQPKSYQQHFRESVFSDKELAIEAYEHAPEEYRIPFDKLIDRLDAAVLAGLAELEEIGTDNPALLEVRCTAIGSKLQALADKASAIIHGTGDALHQDEIDALLGEDTNGTAPA